MVGEREAAKLEAIPLSSNTIQRRISDMAEGIRIQIIENTKKCTYFSSQMDESTDISHSFLSLRKWKNTTKIWTEIKEHL